MSGMVISSAKRKREARPAVDDPELDVESTEVAALVSKRKKARFLPTDDTDSAEGDATNYALSTATSVADSHTRTATFAESNTPLTEASSVRSKTKQRPKKYLCPFPGCDKAFDRPVRLQTHINSHTGERPHACPEDGCDKSFFKAEHLNRHMREKHNEKSFVCEYQLYDEFKKEIAACGKTFESANKLKRHVAMHEEKDETTCDWEGCKKVFRKQETLQRHIKKDHLHEDSYLCKRVLPDGGICGQAFPTPGQLRGHEAREHQAPKYICEVCTHTMMPPLEVEYPVLNDLDPEFLPTPADMVPIERPLDPGMLGELSLEDEGPARLYYPGGVVGFATYHDLQRHNKFVHPPICVQCSKKCTSSKDLAAHMDIMHPPSGVPSREAPRPEKRFPCPYDGCVRSEAGNGFSKKGNLDVHIKNIHSKERDFVCGEYDLSDNKRVEGWSGQGCGLAMKTKQALIGHVRTQHIGVPAAVGARTGLKDKDRTRWIQPKTSAPTEEESSMDVDEETPPAPGREVALSMLTGEGYDRFRPLACLHANEGCKMRFTKPYELGSHLELTHGWNVDDINEALDGEGQTMPGADVNYSDEAFRQQLEAQIRGGGSLVDSHM